MAGSLDGGRIAFLCTDGGERVESTTPVEAFRAAGASASAEMIPLDRGPEAFRARSLDDVGAARPGSAA